MKHHYFRSAIETMGEGQCRCSFESVNWCKPGNSALPSCPMRRLSCLWHVNTLDYPNIDWERISADWCLNSDRIASIRMLCLFDHELDTDGTVFDMMENITALLEEVSYHA